MAKDEGSTAAKEPSFDQDVTGPDAPVTQVLEAAEEAEEQLPEEDSEGLFERAFDYCFEKAPFNADGKKVCPWTSFSTFGTWEEQRRSFYSRWSKNYRRRVEYAYTHQNLGWEAFDVLTAEDRMRAELAAESASGEGVGFIEDLENFDGQDIPKEYYERVRKEGGRLRVVAPRNVIKYRNWGAEDIRVDPKKGDSRFNMDHSQGLLKINECHVMYFPERLKQRRDAIKQKAIDDQMDGVPMAPSREMDPRKKAKLEDRVFSHFKNQGHSDRRAAQLTERAIEGQNGLTPVQRDPRERVVRPAYRGPDGSVQRTRGGYDHHDPRR